MKSPKLLVEVRTTLLEHLKPDIFDDKGRWKYISHCQRVRASFHAEINVSKAEQRRLLQEAQKLLAPLAPSLGCRRMRTKWTYIMYCPDGPLGQYWWMFQCEIVQEALWMYPEFIDGYRFGLHPVEPWRDHNPYSDFARNISWDSGYIVGINNSSVKQWLANLKKIEEAQ